MCTQEQLKQFTELGYVSVPLLSLDVADKLASSVLSETLMLAFQGEDIASLELKRPSLLLNDYDLRKKHLKNPKCVWVKGNPRKPIVSKNFGGVNISHHPGVRDQILFSPRCYEIISSLYTRLCG